MPLITKVLQKQGKNRDRFYVYIDDQFCISIRARTWIGMDLAEGSKISCEEIKILEQNFWKKLYGAQSWKREKVRINRVINWFTKYIPQVEVILVGLGVDRNDYLENIYSAEHGAPDLSIRLHNSEIEVIALEVSGTEKRHGGGYWIRKDKIDHIQSHRKRDIWVVLHYQLPKEEFVWLKIIPDKSYNTKVINLKGADEYYITLTNDAEEIKTSSYFKDYILAKLNKV